MKVSSLRLSPLQFSAIFLLQSFCVIPALAQRDYTVIRPRERAANENVTLSRRATQASKGILGVFLEPIIAGKIVVTDSQGRILDETETDNVEGKAEFELRRGQSYIIKASSPGFLSRETKARLTKSSDIVRLQLQAQFARLELPGIPVGAQVFIDDKLRATANQTGRVVIDNLEPGNHSLLIHHPEYNDYRTPLDDIEAGSRYPFPPLNTILSKVAKLNIQSLPGATVLIDGDLRGKVNANGRVQIDYPLTEATEHTIAIELPGYQPWSSKELLKPGPRELAVKLDPILTSKGTSDGFDNLSLWNAPGDWTIARLQVGQRTTTRLQVSGKTIGLLKGKTYRDFEAVFTVWLNDGKGATWAVRYDKNNYYLFHLTGPKASELAPRKLYTYRVKDGQVTELATPTPLLFEIKEKESYTIFVTVSGHTISHKLQANSNGEESPAIFTDTSNDKDLFLYGSFGFLSFEGEVFQVDDFDIQPKSDQ